MTLPITSTRKGGRRGASPPPRLSLTPGFVLGAALVFYLDGSVVLWSALAAAVHELGHWAVIRLLGGRVTRLRISAIGVEMTLDGRRALSYPRELLAALAGPAASLLAARIAAEYGCFLFAGLSLALGLFNLLPARALDGARVVYALLAWLVNEGLAARVVWALSVLTAGALLGGGAALLKLYGNLTLLITALWLAAGLLKEA